MGQFIQLNLIGIFLELSVDNLVKEEPSIRNNVLLNLKKVLGIFQ